MWITTVKFNDNLYEFKSKMKPLLGQVAYWLWEEFDFEEDTSRYLEGMEVVSMVEKY